MKKILITSAMVVFIAGISSISYAQVAWDTTADNIEAALGIAQGHDEVTIGGQTFKTDDIGQAEDISLPNLEDLGSHLNAIGITASEASARAVQYAIVAAAVSNAGITDEQQIDVISKLGILTASGADLSMGEIIEELDLESALTLEDLNEAESFINASTETGDDIPSLMENINDTSIVTEIIAGIIN